MRRQDFIESKMEGIKFRVSFPGEVVTTQESIDEFSIGFVEWLSNDWVNDERWSIITNVKELLEIYKKEQYGRI